MTRQEAVMTNDTEYDRLTAVFNNFTTVMMVGYTMDGYKKMTINTRDPVHSIE